MDAAAGPLTLARHHLRTNRPERCLDALGRATSEELEQAEFWRIRAQALYMLRRWDEAAETARVGLARHPDDVPLLDRLALSELEAGRPRSAQAALADALSLAPLDPVLVSHRAFLLARAGRAQEATDAVADAMSLAPTSLIVLRTRAQVAALGKDPRAREYSRELLALEPDDDAAHLLGGTAAVQARKIGDGLRHYVEAARLDPSNPRIAWLGRRSRALMHPAASPLRLLWRLGPTRVQVAVLAVLAGLGAAGLRSLHTAVGLVCVAVVAYLVVVRFALRLRFGKRPR